MRDFDPRRVGTLECRAWESYYRRRWVAFLAASIGMVRAAFRMSWPRTLQGAWYVLRANQRWAPVPDNDPDGARRDMERFYRLLADSDAGARFDPRRAAELEVEWRRAHRAAQRDGGAQQPLVDALADLYACSYGAERDAVVPAAQLRRRDDRLRPLGRRRL